MLFIDSFTDRALKLLENPIFKGVTTNPTILKRDRNDCGFEKAVEVLSETGRDNFIQGSLRNDEWVSVLKEKISNGELNPAKLTIKLPWTSSEAAKYVKVLKRILLFKFEPS